ncbi:hypothetical protein ACW5F0_01615 [Luteimonas sp. A534]
MSGPKVVRIVTREEILAICEGHLQRLEQALARWQAQAGRIGELEDADLAATRARHERLRRLMQEDRFADLQKEVPLEIEFLNHDLAQKEERAVSRAAQKRRSQRYLRENASALLRALEAREVLLDSSLVEALKSIAAGRAQGSAEGTLAEGYARLGHNSSPESLGTTQRDLARALQTERPSKWIAEEHMEREPRLDRIDHHIAQLQTLHGATAVEPFLQRLNAIEREPRAGQRSMLLDSFVVDIANAVSEQHARRRQVASLQALASELEALLGESRSALRLRIAACLADPEPDMPHVGELAQQCGSAIEEELRRRAALATRQAVLEGLASLGYEVREGMETAWAEAGSVVLRKPATPGYGVEVGGRAEGGRLQVRAVSLSGTNDRGRDRDIETIWCGEFARLRSLLAERGSELAIEKALAVGEVPLKVIESDIDADRGVFDAGTKSSS